MVVSDTGCGVPQEHIDRIFDRLHQVPDSVYRTRRGLGLGLFITREIIQGLGGSIRVESNPGSGTRFEIDLPTFTWSGAITPLLTGARRLSSLKVLVVTIAWPDPNADEPVPGSIIRMLRGIIELALQPHSHTLVPPCVAPGVVRLGAIAAVDRRAWDAILRNLRKWMRADPGVADSGLEVTTRTASLAGSGGTRSIGAASRILERYFIHQSPRGASCVTHS